MSTQDKARELMVQERLTDEERHEKMVTRAVETQENYQEDLEEEARERLAQERHNEASLDDKMLHRAVEEIK